MHLMAIRLPQLARAGRRHDVWLGTRWQIPRSACPHARETHHIDQKEPNVQAAAWSWATGRESGTLRTSPHSPWLLPDAAESGQRYTAAAAQSYQHKQCTRQVALV
jgi:hypothetical protein